MDTCFAAPERASAAELRDQSRLANADKVVRAMLHCASGMVAVLNECRQVVAVNERLLSQLSPERPEDVLGLRPGEALNCTFADKGPGGCGTSDACRNCGAVLTVLAAQESNEPRERTCVVRVETGLVPADLHLSIRCAPLPVGDQRFLMVFMEDMSNEQRLLASERVFYHDIFNMLSGLSAACQLVAMQAGDETREFAEQARRLCDRVVQELRMQRELRSGGGTLRPRLEPVGVEELLGELDDVLSRGDAARDRQLRLDDRTGGAVLRTDRSLVMRVLTNMGKNALEATPEGGEVRIVASRRNGRVEFSAWNPGCMPPEVSARIFHRNFSTKATMGRGLGTYSMKLFGETTLGGEVDFTSTLDEGTTFRFRLPSS